MGVKETVLDFLKSHAKNPLPGGNEEEYLACRYLDLGVIDSLGIVEMIMEIEEKYGIAFTNDHMQSYDFQTVGGVITLVESLIKEAQ